MFIHLGDVIYGHDKAKLFRDEFYRPYTTYPGKIIAIPGNHDGETFPQTDPTPLKAFRDNFCAPAATVPRIASDVRIFRETISSGSNLRTSLHRLSAKLWPEVFPFHW